jgi:hypothetical protein
MRELTQGSMLELSVEGVMRASRQSCSDNNPSFRGPGSTPFYFSEILLSRYNELNLE